MKAIWNKQIIAESDKTVFLENNYYFPPQSVNMALFQKTDNQYTCPWKGLCDYYSITAGGTTNPDGAWMYAQPSKRAEHVKGYFAFWHGVEITK